MITGQKFQPRIPVDKWGSKSISISNYALFSCIGERLLERIYSDIQCVQKFFDPFQVIFIGVSGHFQDNFRPNHHSFQYFSIKQAGQTKRLLNKRKRKITRIGFCKSLVSLIKTTMPKPPPTSERTVRILSFGPIRDAKEEYQVSMFFRLRWKDPRLCCGKLTDGHIESEF